jgi:hypothetical protein
LIQSHFDHICLLPCKHELTILDITKSNLAIQLLLKLFDSISVPQCV